MSASIRLSSSTGRWVLLATVLGPAWHAGRHRRQTSPSPRSPRSSAPRWPGLQWTVNAYTPHAGRLHPARRVARRPVRPRRSSSSGGVVRGRLGAVRRGADIPMLIAARPCRGWRGTAHPGSLAIIQASFVQGDRPRAVGAWSGSAGWPGRRAVPGRWLVGAAGWRWVFPVEPAAGRAGGRVAVRHVPDRRRGRHGRFDVLGAALAALCLAGSTYALTIFPEKGVSVPCWPAPRWPGSPPGPLS